MKRILLSVVVIALLCASCGTKVDYNKNVSSEEAVSSTAAVSSEETSSEEVVSEEDEEESSEVEVSSMAVASQTTSSKETSSKPQATTNKSDKESKVITLPDENSEEWALFLVNNYNELPSGYNPKTVSVGNSKEFHAKAADALNKMLSAAEKSGNKLFLVSAYRTVSYQKGLFERNVQKLMNSGMSKSEATAETAINIAQPGKSEHNTGLAADIVSSDWYTYNTDLTASFEKTSHFKWLSKNAHKYGFILRYPKGKEDITEITYEPWHYRYVGEKYAKLIYESGLCLEEYMETLN